MNRTELVDAIAVKADISKKDADAATKIKACTAPKFKAGKALKDKVNTKPSKKCKK